MYNLFKQTLILAIISLLAFFNIILFHDTFFGWLVFLVYLWLTASSSFWVLVRFFVWPEKLWRIRFLGAFISLCGLGLWSVPFILFARLTGPVIALILFLNSFVLFLLGQWAKNAKNVPALELPEKDFYLEDGSSGPLGVVIYLLLVIYGFYLLHQGVAVGNLSTPWATINHSYIYIFAISTLLLGLLIFSRLQGKTILFLLVLHSFLLHSYLPLTYQLIYGADAWRHLAVETQILTEQKISSAVYDTTSFLHALNPGQFSYSQLWGLTVISSRLLDINLLSLNVWLLPILWPIIFSILLFEFAFALGWKKKESLFFVFLSLLPFIWQVAGAFTLPVNFGFLFWFLAMLLLLKHLKEKRPGQRTILLLFGLALAGGYILYFILFWLAWAMAELLVFCYPQFTQKSKINWHILGINMLTILLGLAMALVIPIIELLTKYSIFSRSLNWLKQSEQMIGNFSALYLASGPRPHDIATGNIIFNQTPLYAFVPNLFTEWRWWLVGVAITIIFLAIWGFVLMVFQSKEIKYRWLAVLGLGVFGSYVISRYFLAGENILSRRLDVILALFIFLFFFHALRYLFERVVKLRRLLVALTVFIVTLAISASYSLGPDTWTVSMDEYQGAQYIAKNEQQTADPCVVADTYPLLALEALSARHIVGGGFPMDEYFAQPARTQLFNELTTTSNRAAWLAAMKITKSDHCWFMVNKNNFVANDFFDAQGKQTYGFGDILIWKYNKN